MPIAVHQVITIQLPAVTKQVHVFVDVVSDVRATTLPLLRFYCHVTCDVTAQLRLTRPITTYIHLPV